MAKNPKEIKKRKRKQKLKNKNIKRKCVGQILLFSLSDL